MLQVLFTCQHLVLIATNHYLAQLASDWHRLAKGNKHNQECSTNIALGTRESTLACQFRNLTPLNGSSSFHQCFDMLSPTALYLSTATTTSHSKSTASILAFIDCILCSWDSASSTLFRSNTFVELIHSIIISLLDNRLLLFESRNQLCHQLLMESGEHNFSTQIDDEQNIGLFFVVTHDDYEKQRILVMMRLHSFIVPYVVS